MTVRRETCAIVSVLGLALLLAGCNLLDEGGSPPNFAAGPIDLTVDGGSGLVTGVSTYAWSSSDAEVSGLDYWIVLSPDSVAHTYDTVVYKGSVSIPAKGKADIKLDWSDDIADYAAQNSVAIAPNSYHLGLILDPENRIEQSDKENNTSISGDPFWVIGNTPCASVAEGTVILDPNLNYYDDALASWQNMGSGATTLFAGFIPYDFDFASVAQSADPDTLFVKGWQGQSVSYNPTGRVNTFRCGAAVRGDYVLFLFVDANSNGRLDLDSPGGNPVEPYAFYPSGSVGVVHLTEDLSGLAIEIAQFAM